LNFSKISSDGDVNFAEWLTKKHNVATIPTSVFNSNKEDFTQIRVCFAKEEKTLMKAASILNGI
jgi:methionine aminotransferase